MSTRVPKIEVKKFQIHLQLDLAFVGAGRGLHRQGLEGDAGREGVAAGVGLAVFVADVNFANRHLQILDDVDRLKKKHSTIDSTLKA